MFAPSDFDKRQQVEGYASLVNESNRHTFGGLVLGPDFRGESSSAMTSHWFRPRRTDESDLAWLTAAAPQAADTTFVFVGESADLPENIFPSNQATLYVDDQRTVTFDLGQRQRRLWTAGEWALEFIPKRMSTSGDSVHRQFGLRGDCGIYRLAAPASVLTAGKPVTIRVAMEPQGSDVITWFAVRERSDVLREDSQTNAEQIQCLQDELIRLKKIVGNLARRNYPELFPERIASEEVLMYTNGLAHVHVPDVLLLQNGDILSAFREATEHLSNDGHVVMVRSTDGGKTWDKGQILTQFADTDERECAICQLRDGTVLANEWPNTYYDRDGYYLATPTTHHSRQMGMYVGRSYDNGHTWEWPEIPMSPAPYLWAVSSERIVELPSGRLLMAYYCGGESRRQWGSAIYCSDDKGLSWRYLSTVANIPDKRLGEPGLIETKSGRLICLMRDEDGLVYYQSNSDDSGATWSPAWPTTIPGLSNPAALVTLTSGVVLCIYGARAREASPYSPRDDFGGLYIVASNDNGMTWDMANRKVIRDDFANMDIGYPSCVQLPDGRVLAAYYFNMFGRFFIAGNFFTWES